MKQYRLLQRNNELPVLVNVNSNLYVEYIDSGYFVTASGNKKDLQDQLHELVSELADCD